MDQFEEINNESDHEPDSPKGYYTRAKRRKLCEKYQDAEDSFSNLCAKSDRRKRKNLIMFVPTEVLQRIFEYISYHELSSTLRLVNRRFKTVAEDLLNFGFKRIEKRLKSLMGTTDLALGYTQDDMEIKCISKLLCLLEILISQCSVIVSTIWRYVYNGFYKTRNTCMYGGLIIDIFDIFMWKFLHCPNQLYAPAVIKDYSLPLEVSRIVQLTKAFCIHFDKTNEEVMSSCCILSGCKIADILDSAKFANKHVHYEKRVSNFFLAKFSYYFKNSWFVAMPIPSGKAMDWPQQQRMMHMRLRRIVLAHNDMYLQQEQYKREVSLRPNAPTAIKKPGNNVYTGYGDVEDKFFYYGVMNDGAFRSKFHPPEDVDGRDEEDEPNEMLNNPAVEPDLFNFDDDVLFRLPYLGFKVDLSIRCPLAYAPLSYLRTLGEDELGKMNGRALVKGESQLHMDFECFGAHYARLPVRYQYEVGRRC
ncbi:uncharacterized protein [Euwallacea fornicatus]|uniref:uncharacterized protein isoform X1 n=1 Tax=Euwallacea fornicatus TaxID=995702 RepID=UPI0033904847